MEIIQSDVEVLLMEITLEIPMMGVNGTTTGVDVVEEVVRLGIGAVSVEIVVQVPLETFPSGMVSPHQVVKSLSSGMTA